MERQSCHFRPLTDTSAPPPSAEGWGSLGSLGVLASLGMPPTPLGPPSTNLFVCPLSRWLCGPGSSYTYSTFCPISRPGSVVDPLKSSFSTDPLGYVRSILMCLMCFYRINRSYCTYRMYSIHFRRDFPLINNNVVCSFRFPTD